MCGIVGFYGQNNGSSVTNLVNGLKRLEYRGYDSSGIAILKDDSDIFCYKKTGRIKNLEAGLKDIDLSNLKGIGISHTRWATHGEPSDINAHPHLSNDNKIALVHNGIIENYKSLKEFLIQKGYIFRSQTDSEVVVNLISYYYKDNLKQAILDAIGQIQGAFALLIISSLESNKLFGVKKSSPLVFGIGDKEYFLASDVSAILNKTRNVIYLEDNEIVEINSDNYQITDFSDNLLTKNTEYIEWDDNQANKEGYEHFLLKEIMEQPKIVLDSIRGRIILDTADVNFGGLMDVKEKLKNINKVVLIGIGTAYYACKLGEMFFEEIAQISAKAEMSPEFRYKKTVLDKNTWVIAVSQSGETADTIAAIEEAKKRGCLVTGIVNTVGSTISRITEAGVYNHIGPEIAVASTKAFTSQVLILLMHSIFLGRQNSLGFTQSKNLLEDINSLSDNIEEVFKNTQKIKEIAEKYANSNSMIYMGRRYNYPIALEGSLKIKEISYIHAEGLSAGELKHGFIALVDENLPVVAICTQDSVYEKMLSNIEEVKARRGKVIVIVNEVNEHIKQICEDYILVPKAKTEELQTILNNVVLQLLAYYTTVVKGLDVDKPRNLAKSVTVE